MPPVLYSGKSDGRPILGSAQMTGRYYLRFCVEDKPGTLGKITTILGKNGISIETIIQKTRQAGGEDVPIIIMTHEASEKNLRKAIPEIEKSAISAVCAAFMRIEEI